ncbi:MAG TPA: undecaprenyl diphosphate synthase family protein [Candidatus Saccharimonadales bacterium]|nr:undecaprenyl diphosphate synthase family protein [Candidatus Saccharimonadales bacterium]
MNTQLTHLALILDGNRRWAKQHGLTEAGVYKRAGGNIGDILETAFELGVQCVSLWVGSYANLANRSPVLVKALDKVYGDKFKELLAHPSVAKKQVKIEVIGEWRDLLSKATKAAAEKAIQATAHHAGPKLVMLIGYDGTRERGAAVQSLLKDPVTAPGDPMEAEALLRRHSWSGHLPNVDLIIRTGVWQDPHNSAGFYGFLTSEAQYSFPPVLWPDFTPAMLQSICQNFLGRERRFGT